MASIREQILEGVLETDEAFDDGQLLPADEAEARIAEAVAAERERCAQVAAEFRHPNPFPTVYAAIATAIRDGGNHDG